jgi:amino acid transporter
MCFERVNRVVKELFFSYQEYSDSDTGAFLVQAIALCLGLLYMLSPLIRPKAFRRKRDSQRRVNDDLFDIIGRTAIRLSILILLIVSLVLYLVSGMGGLFYEKEEDAIVTYGTVESGEMCTKVFYPIYHGSEFGTSIGQYIYIDGERYYIMCAQELYKGDKVKLSYLPDSRYILTCDIIQPSNQRNETVFSDKQSVLSYIFLVLAFIAFADIWSRALLHRIAENEKKPKWIGWFGS